MKIKKENDNTVHIINIHKVEDAVKAAANKVKSFMTKKDEPLEEKREVVIPATERPIEPAVPITERISELVDPKKCAELTQRMEGNDSVPEVKKQQAPNDYEYVNHPNHYNEYDIEAIDMMRRIWGNEQTANWCKLTAFKYRLRMGLKPDNDISQDLKKEQWYLDKYHELIGGVLKE